MAYYLVNPNHEKVMRASLIAPTPSADKLDTVYCKECADGRSKFDSKLDKPNGLVPFEYMGDGPFGGWHQMEPWCWTSNKIGKPCANCGKQV